MWLSKASIKKLRKKSKEGDFSGTRPRSVQSLSISFALEAETLWPRIEAEKTAVGKQLGLGAAGWGEGVLLLFAHLHSTVLLSQHSPEVHFLWFSGCQLKEHTPVGEEVRACQQTESPPPHLLFCPSALHFLYLTPCQVSRPKSRLAVGPRTATISVFCFLGMNPGVCQPQRLVLRSSMFGAIISVQRSQSVGGYNLRRRDSC